MKHCRKCSLDKAETEFYERAGKLSSHCRKCHSDYSMAWRLRFPGRRRAHIRVANAIKYGDIVRPNKCERCQSETYTIAHHADYRRPLLVEWLCDGCHRRHHAAKTKGRVGRLTHSHEGTEIVRPSVEVGPERALEQRNHGIEIRPELAIGFQPRFFIDKDGFRGGLPSRLRVFCCRSCIP